MTDLKARQTTAIWTSIEQYLARIENGDTSARAFGSDNCACCVEFANNDCVDCPIANYTGERSCAATPYDDMCDEWNALLPSARKIKQGVLAEYRFLIDIAMLMADDRMELAQELAATAKEVIEDMYNMNYPVMRAALQYFSDPLRVLALVDAYRERYEHQPYSEAVHWVVRNVVESAIDAGENIADRVEC